MESRVEKCLGWLRNENGIKFYDRFGIVGFILEWADNVEKKDNR